MSKEGSVAPQERVNITYKPSTGGGQEEVELPLKMLLIGDYTGRPDERALEDRKPVDVNKENFQEVLAEQKLALTMMVPNQLSEEKGAELKVELQFRKLGDFGPDAVAAQIPELKALLEVREALTALKGPLGNVPAFRKKIQALLADATSQGQLMRELGLAKEEG